MILRNHEEENLRRIIIILFKAKYNENQLIIPILNQFT